MMTLKARTNTFGFEVNCNLTNGFEIHLFDEEMGLDKNQTANSMILNASGINRGDRTSITVTEEDSSLEPNLRQYLG